MYCLLIAGGAADDLPADAAALGRFDVLVCADGGVHNARRLGLIPHVVVGDFDSIGQADEERLLAEGCVIVRHPPAKDETDLELALLWCKERGATKIVVLGAFGGRPDHALANVMLLTDRRLRDIDVRLRSRAWEVWLTRTTTDIHGQKGDAVSLLPLSARVDGVRTDGLQYPLRGETLRRGPARGVSNAMTGTAASVAVQRGMLLVLHGPIP